MEYIFHETQEGLLCAQHCLNSLLQGDYYSAPDLANIAMELDAMEQTIQNPSSSHESSNYDDTGYFSIQVIQTALKQWNLDLIPFKSQNDMAKLARENPTQMQAYICNFKQHWYTIRKLGKYWFNLNSMLSKPELISDTYLAVLLKQLETDGYSIFIVDGELPKCDAERNLSVIELDTREILNRQVQGRARTSRTLDNEGFDDKELKRAIKMSLIENDRGLDADANSKLFPGLVYEAHDDDDDDDDEGQLREAIKMSLEGNREAAQAATSKEETPVSESAAAENSAEEIRRKRLKYLDNLSKSQPDSQ